MIIKLVLSYEHEQRRSGGGASILTCFLKNCEEPEKPSTLLVLQTLNHLQGRTLPVEVNGLRTLKSPLKPF